MCHCSAHAGLPLNEDLQMTFKAGDACKSRFTTFLCEGHDDSTGDLLPSSGKYWHPGVLYRFIMSDSDYIARAHYSVRYQWSLL